MRLRPGLSLALALVAAGCAALPKVGPDHVAPDPAPPAAWHAAAGVVTAPSTQVAEEAWWRVFGDPVLDALVADVLTANRDLAAARADLRRARALRAVAAGGLGPQGGASAQAQSLSQSENGLIPFGQIPGTSADTELFDAGFDARWELDLFGGARRGVEAAQARADATLAAVDEVRLSLAGETARTYFEVRGAQHRLAAARRSAELQRATRDLVAAKVRAGEAAQFDLDRAELALRATEAGLPAIEAEERAGAYRLAVLTAQSPAEAFARVSAPRPLPPTPDLSVAPPRQVLLRRPDLRRAERLLAAEVADIGIATAELYPKLSLFGALGGQSVDASDLLKSASRTAVGGVGLQIPIFNRGALRAQVEAEEAQAEAALRRFEQTSLSAVQEVETALARYLRARDIVSARRSAAASARRAAHLARLRHQGGEDALSVVIDAERDLAEAESQLAQSQTTTHIQAVAVFKATGGTLR